MSIPYAIYTWPIRPCLRCGQGFGDAPFVTLSVESIVGPMQSDRIIPGQSRPKDPSKAFFFGLLIPTRNMCKENKARRPIAQLYIEMWCSDGPGTVCYCNVLLIRASSRPGRSNYAAYVAYLDHRTPASAASTIFAKDLRRFTWMCFYPQQQPRSFLQSPEARASHCAAAHLS